MAQRADFRIKKDAAKHLSSFLVTNGLITAEQLDQAVTASNESDRGLIETILEFGFTVEDDIASGIGGMYGLEVARLRTEEDINVSALKLIPTSFIEQNRIIPFEEIEGTLKVAISEPNSLNTVPGVRTITNKKVVPYVITFSDMAAILDRLAGGGELPPSAKSPAPTKLKAVQRKKTGSVSPSLARRLGDKKEKDSDSKDEAVLSSEVVTLVDQVIHEAIKADVSDIHIEPYKTSSRIRFRKDGVLQDKPVYSKTLGEHYAAVTTRIKIMSSLDIAERRLPQDGAFSVQDGSKEIDLRVSILPTAFGERVVMRLLDGSSANLTLEKMGLTEADEATLKIAVDSPQGLVLVTGPTGSGKSTTLYSVLGRLNQIGVNILTAEDPVEYNMEGVGQVLVKEEIGLTFSSALRSFLRQDPEVIMVGEIRDQETANIAIKAALTGHMVLSTLHTNDSVSTITRLLNMDIPGYLISSSLAAIVAQRLARKVCDGCRKIDEDISTDQYLTMGFTVEEASRSKLYIGAGCKACNNTGCSGRRGIYEVLSITDGLREGILKGMTTLELLAIAKEQDGFHTMQDMGRSLMMQGEISAQEFRRVLLM
jgi:type IV pilus assembly protein PilB